MRLHAGALVVLLLIAPAAGAQNPQELPEIFWLECVHATSPKQEMLAKLDRKQKKVYVKIPKISEGKICLENDDAIWMNDRCDGKDRPEGSRGKGTSAVFNKWNGSLTVLQETFTCQAHETVMPKYK